MSIMWIECTYSRYYFSCSVHYVLAKWSLKQYLSHHSLEASRFDLIFHVVDDCCLFDAQSVVLNSSNRECL
jgi:hypothetical protein